MKTRRYVAFYVLFAIVSIIIAMRLVNLQIINGSQHREKSNTRTIRTVELIAPRGEILDRNGRAIVSNRTAYNVYILSNRERSTEKLNEVIFNLSHTVTTYDEYVKTVLPIEYDGNAYKFIGETNEISKWKKNNGFGEKDDESLVIGELCKRYEIDLNKLAPEDVLAIAGTRLNMANRGFSAASPYLFAEDVPMQEISVIKEQSVKFPDVSIVTQPIREYPYKTLGAHMLGRVGVINAEEYELNSSNGYTINSNIGKSGIEKYLEAYLRGENGRGIIEHTTDGHSMGQSVELAPVSGRNVNLTIDIDMQIACEEALEETVRNIRRNADSLESGGGADAGSMVVIDVNTGDILAMASYPSYDITTFNQNYNKLLKNPSKPLFNRALAGTYSPASTFKLLVGSAALEENIIGTQDEILDTGKYTYFKDYQPGCWIYNQYGTTHGYLNVAEAIRDSCNVFFFDVGRRLTIEKINEYAKKFGFGQKSGIELSDEEKIGVVAGPESRKASGGSWYPGDVCQTAIGQSDTLVTPIQLANYIATFANGGTRYKPHLIKSVQDKEGNISEETAPEILEKIEIADENLEAILYGLRMVVTEGTAEKAFEGCQVPVAAKTGSAQTSGVYTNGVCVAFAPYDKPRIAIACVIEKAGSGANVAQAVRKVVDSYFDEVDENDIETNTLTR